MFFAFFFIRQLDFRLGDIETSVLCALSCSFGYARRLVNALRIMPVYDLLRWNPDGQNNLQLAPSTDRFADPEAVPRAVSSIPTAPTKVSCFQSLISLRTLQSEQTF
jgi:hypothetical protein